MKPCAVLGCFREAKREGLCPPCCLTWLVSRGSDRTPRREDRLRAFVAKMSARNFSRDIHENQSGGRDMKTKALKKMWREWAKESGEHFISFRKRCALMASNSADAQPEETAAALWLRRKGWRL